MESEKLKPCPFCGEDPIREVRNNILTVHCPQCVSVGFHNHVRLGCLADTQWNNRAKIAPSTLDEVRKEFEEMRQGFADIKLSEKAREDKVLMASMKANHFYADKLVVKYGGESVLNPNPGKCQETVN